MLFSKVFFFSICCCGKCTDANIIFEGKRAKKLQNTHFCEGKISWSVFKGFHLTQMNSRVLGTHLGVKICPQTDFSDYFKWLSSFSGNWGGPLAHPCGHAYLPWWPVAVLPWLGSHDGLMAIFHWLPRAGGPDLVGAKPDLVRCFLR